MQERVFAIAFTDSVHSLTHQEAPDSVFEFYEKVNKICVVYIHFI